MKMGAAFPGKYLKAGDLQGRSVTANISHVVMEDVGSGSQAENKPVLYFQGKERGLVLNVTNSNTICQYYGDESDVWTGKPLEIFPSTTDFGGKTVDCIRVRVPVAPVAPAAAQGVPTNTQTVATAAQAPVSEINPPMPDTAPGDPIDDVPF